MNIVRASILLLSVFFGACAKYKVYQTDFAEADAKTKTAIKLNVETGESWMMIRLPDGTFVWVRMASSP